MARRRRALDQEFHTQRQSLRQSNRNLAREAADTSVDSGARFHRIVGLQREIETTEQRSAELAAERKDLDSERINAEVTRFVSVDGARVRAAMAATLRPDNRLVMTYLPAEQAEGAA